MYLTPAKLSDLGTCYKRGNNQEIIEEFANSGNECMKIEGWAHKNAAICARAMNRSIQSCGYYSAIRATQKGNDVYLVKL